MQPGDVGLDEMAMQLYGRAAESIHVEHLLVLYSTGLPIKAVMAVDHRCRLPMADSELEKMYKHFEWETPLGVAFTKYTSSRSLANETIRKLFPAKDST